MNTVTPGIAREIAKGNIDVVRFVIACQGAIVPEREPSMIVGRPGQVGIVTEDKGRTLILPLPATCPKVYVELNETGGTTIMLANEH